MHLPEMSAEVTRLGGHVSTLSGTLLGNTALVIGIDPGVNFGMTVIDGENVKVFWGKLQTDKRPGWRGIYAYQYVMTHELFEGRTFRLQKAIVEGAAYFKPHGQVGLEEVRFGFFLALHHLGFSVEIVPPATIRKKAFGGGRIQAGEIWPALKQDAVDSIGCALAALE